MADNVLKNKYQLAYLTNKRHEITLSKDFKGQALYDAYMKCY